MSALDALNQEDLDAEIAALEADLGDDIDLDALLEDEPEEVLAEPSVVVEEDAEIAALDEELAEEAAKTAEPAAKKKAAPKKTAAKKERKATKEPKKFRTTLAGGGDPSTVIMERVSNIRLFEMSNADKKKSDKELEAVRDAILKKADGLMKKPRAKITNLFESLERGTGLSIFTQLYFKQLRDSADGITTKDMFEYLQDGKVNGHRPYGVSTARAMCSQYHKLFQEFGIAVKVEDTGRIKLNEDSALAERVQELVAV